MSRRALKIVINVHVHVEPPKSLKSLKLIKKEIEKYIVEPVKTNVYNNSCTFHNQYWQGNMMC